MRQVQIAINTQYGDAEIMWIRIKNSVFTVEAKEYDKMIYARYFCHFRCKQTDLYLEQNGTWTFVVQNTEDTSWLKTAWKP